MSLGSDELAGLSEELLVETRIASPTYCGECGYNLQKLPYLYRCPECGNAYNARPLSMNGIFFRESGYFPLGELFSVLVSLAAAAVLAYSAIEPVAPVVGPSPGGGTGTPVGNWQITDSSRLGMAALFAALAFVYIWRTYRQMRRFVKRLVITHRIAQEED